MGGWEIFGFGVPGLGVRLTWRVGIPAFGSSSIASHEIARSSYSRFPHMSQTQAGKLGTVISSSPSHVKYVIIRRCITPALHSVHGKDEGMSEGVRCSFIGYSTPRVRQIAECSTG